MKTRILYYKTQRSVKQFPLFLSCNFVNVSTFLGIRFWLFHPVSSLAGLVVTLNDSEISSVYIETLVILF